MILPNPPESSCQTWRWALLLALIAQLCAGAAAPDLELVSIIGDMRGKGMQNQSVAISDDGAIYLLMRTGRVAVFNPGGTYRGSRQVELGPHAERCRLDAVGNRLLLGNFLNDFPWAADLRRQGDAPGRFRSPRDGAMDSAGRIYIADTDNKRVQIFSPDDTLAPVAILDLPARPTGLGLRMSQLAVLLDDRSVRLYSVAEGATPPSLLSSGATGPDAKAVAVASDGAIVVAFSGGRDRFRLKLYRRDGDTISEEKTIARAYVDQWPSFFPSATPMVRGPQGGIWFPSRDTGHVLRLDARTDEVEVRLAKLHRPSAVAFGADGTLYVATHGPRILRFAHGATEAGQGKPFPVDGNLCPDSAVPIWSMLPANDGTMVVRVVETGHQKGWPAVTIKRVRPDGDMTTLIDFGPLYAKRVRFPPWEGFNALAFDAGGNIVLTVHPMLAVFKLTPDGKTIWEASSFPQGGAGSVEFSHPRDIALDSHDNVWVADSGAHQIVCLSPDGRLLGRYGTHGDIDNVDSIAFDHPSGIAVTHVDNDEFLYVGDAGNQRILKLRIVADEQ